MIQDEQGREIGCFGLPFYILGKFIGGVVAAPFVVIYGIPSYWAYPASFAFG